MSNLFELSTKFAELLNMVDEDCTIEELQDTLDSIQADMDTKVDNTVGLIRSVEADVEAIDKEVKRLQELKRSKVNFVDRLKGYLQDALEVQDIKKYRTSTNYIYKRKNAPSKDIVDETKIPSEYWLSQAPKLNTKQLVDDLKAGKDIPGAQLKHTVSLVVK